MLINKTSVRVRYKDTDAMGITYYANYLVWFEVGRTEWLRSLGPSFSELLQSDLFIPVIKVSCRYKAPARFDDELTVITWIDSLRGVRVTFNYEIRRGEQILALGSTEHAFVNAQGRPVALRKKNPFLWKKLLQALESNPPGQA